MDPLTHTLVGASLSATRLTNRTRGAAAALVLGANLPDIDVLSYFAGSDMALGFRRGWTHGLPALAVLPILLAVTIRIWAHFSGRTGQRPVSTRWLVALSYLAIVTHPLLDWLNTYGMRWLAPFRDTWFYGDSLFIVDPWLWLALGSGWLLGRKPTRALVGTVALVGALLMSLTALAVPTYIPIVIFVFLFLMAAALYFSSSFSPHRIALRGLTVALVYIAAMLVLHGLTEWRVDDELNDVGLAAQELMVGPRPANPLAWEFVARVGNEYRFGQFDWFGGSLETSPRALPAAAHQPEWTTLQKTSSVAGFRRWARFPWLEVEPTAKGRRVFLMDARYRRERTTGFGGTDVELPTTTDTDR
ncbi:MAG: metal-dependent hydrolase [Acidobacteriota bacterium]|nr:metal-dependent hydrolase [Acidobacteriota bacterium]